MPALYDIANVAEFAFTPSAFVCAYIEQEEKSQISDTSSKSGGITQTHSTATMPTGNTPSAVTTASVTGVAGSGQPVTVIPLVTPVASSANSQYNFNWSSADGSNSTADTTSITTSKTDQKNSGLLTVVLVLTSGTFRAKCANANTTITAIYTAVYNYLDYVATH